MDIEAAKSLMEKRIAETRRIKQAETRQEWLDAKAVERGELRGHAYWIVPSPGMAREPLLPERLGFALGGLNGYVHFAPRPLVEPEEGGILRYVPVHGGITFWGNHDGGVVYGFDTGHYDSHEFPTRDPAWVKQEIEHMLNGVEMAAKVEAQYLAATDEQVRIAAAEEVRSVRRGQPLAMGAVIQLMGGKV